MGENNYPFKVNQIVMSEPKFLFSDNSASSKITQVYYNAKKEIVYHKPLKNDAAIMSKLLVPALIPDFWDQLLPDTLLFHMHPFCEIAQVLSGRGIYIIDNQVIEVKKNDIILFNENIPHFWYPDPTDPALINVYHFFPKLLLNTDSNSENYLYIYSLNPNDFQYLYFNAENKLNRRLTACLNCIFREFSNAAISYQAMIIAKLLEISTTIIRHLDAEAILSRKSSRNKQESSSHNAVDSAIDYISKHYTDSELNVVQIARTVSMNSNYFSNLFKKNTGMTPTGYITHLRIAKAVELLNSTTLSITEIGQRCGYLSFSSFYRSFSSIMGQSPSSYRKTGA